MFTGIIRHTGRITDALDVAPGAGGQLRIATELAASEGEGDSIAVNGCCLTLVSNDDGVARFDVIPETVQNTMLGGLEAGDVVNLEPALRVGQPMGGHWLQGHVDGVGEVRFLHPQSNALDVEVLVPPEVERYCVHRGSIGINGVSLTVMGLEAGLVRVSLIPETLHRTNLGDLQVGSPVNVEADVLAKYVGRLLEPYRPG